METLYARALLCMAGLASEEMYSEALHARFLSCPDDDLLLALECETDPCAAADCLQRYFTCHPLDRSRFGRSLIEGLSAAYRAAADLGEFTDRLYLLWNHLPADLIREPPFWTLSYAGDPLSYGDEAQTRRLCEAMLRHYDQP